MVEKRPWGDIDAVASVGAKVEAAIESCRLFVFLLEVAIFYRQLVFIDAEIYAAPNSQPSQLTFLPTRISVSFNSPVADWRWQWRIRVL